MPSVSLSHALAGKTAPLSFRASRAESRADRRFRKIRFCMIANILCCPLIKLTGQEAPRNYFSKRQNLGAKRAQNPAFRTANRGFAGESGPPNQHEFCGVMERAMGIEPRPEAP